MGRSIPAKKNQRLHMHPKIIFYQVKDSSSKLSKICQTALQHFSQKEPLLILVPDQAALDFVDALLWKYPEESFLPHGTDSKDLITIGTKYFDGVRFLFNLCPDPISFTDVYTIYELEDLTSPAKAEASQSRYTYYRQKEYPISNWLK